MIWRTKPQKLIAVLLTKSVTEALKAAARLGATGLTGSSIAGDAAGAAAKALADAIFDQVSAVERKLDILLRVDLLTGTYYLRDGLTLAQSGARSDVTDEIFHDAYKSLTRALTIVLDSREDAAVVGALRAMALSAHSARQELATQALRDVELDRNTLHERLELLRSGELTLREDAVSLDRFLSRDPLRDKPFGYMEQRLFARWVRQGLTRRQQAVVEAERRVEAIDGFVAAARTLLKSQLASSSALS